MVYLIGGPPRSGKTILSEKLAAKKSYPYFALDHITSVISPYIPGDEYQSKLPLRMARREANYDNDIFYSKYSPEEIVGFYRRQSEAYWSGFENFIKYAIRDEHDLIIEGWQLLPHLLSTIITPENLAKLKIIFIYKISVKNIIGGLKANLTKNDWVVKNTKAESTFLAIAQTMSLFGRYIEKEAKKYNFRSINTDFDFTKKIEESLEFMLK